MKFKIADYVEIGTTNAILGVLGHLDKAIDFAIAGLFTIGVQVSLKYIERRFFKPK